MKDNLNTLTKGKHMLKGKQSLGFMWWGSGVDPVPGIQKVMPKVMQVPVRSGIEQEQQDRSEIMPRSLGSGDIKTLPRWHPDRELSGNRSFTGTDGASSRFGSLDLLTRLEELLKDTQAAKTSVQSQP
jgi:hypothetical protein